MSDLTPEDRDRIYQEEKVRAEAQAQIKAESDQKQAIQYQQVLQVRKKAEADATFGRNAAYGLIFIVVAIFVGCGVHNCGSSAPTTPPVEVITPDDPISQKMRLYGGASYDDQRQSLCNHIMQNPDVALAKDAHTDSGDIEVVMRSGATDDDILTLAKRLRRYMTENYKGDDTYIVSNITVFHNISDAPYAKPDDPPLDDPTGMMALMVTTGMDDTDSSHDTSWHILKDSKILE